MTLKVPTYKLRRGNSALIVSMPHVGTYIPAWLAPRLTVQAKELTDTDWHLQALYNFLEELDATIISATHSRYLIDLNRPFDNTNLYPSNNTTSLCPLDTFDLHPIYISGAAPTIEEVEQRIANYWQPYHTALTHELARIKSNHGRAMLWDAHSIKSQVPRFFEGQLSNLNFGTVDDQSCSPSLTLALKSVTAKFNQFSHVENGRFKGGYITRQYGKPLQNVHAVQMEIAQRSYMQETPPYELDEELCRSLRPALHSLLETMLHWQETQRTLLTTFF